MIDVDTLHFILMRNIIHSDEKWFNTTKKAKKFYMLPEEEDPHRKFKTRFLFLNVCSYVM
jgi:hypothetical protein